MSPVNIWYEKDAIPTYPFYVALEVDEEPALKPYIHLIKQAPLLEELKLTYIDDMTGFDEAIKCAQNLLRLKLDGCDFEHFPRQISSLRHLRRFSYIYCDFLPEEIFETLAELPHLMDLSLLRNENSDPEYLPPAFCRCKNLEEIDFSRWTTLAALPENIAELGKLRSIVLANEDDILGDISLLSMLPESLCDLSALEKLDVYGCQNLKKLPQGFRKLKKLNYLDTFGSGIHEVDLSDEQWRQMRHLRINRQEIDFSKCQSLKELAIENDQDSPLDLSGIAGIKSLTTLEVIGGVLLSDDFLSAMPKLTNVRLDCKIRNK